MELGTLELKEISEYQNNDNSLPGYCGTNAADSRVVAFAVST